MCGDQDSIECIACNKLTNENKHCEDTCDSCVEIKCVKCKISKKLKEFRIRRGKVNKTCNGCLDHKNKSRKKCKCGLHQPNFGYINDPIPEYCNACKAPQMINLKNRKCICTKKRPSFGYPGDLRADYCASCKLPGMTNVVNRRCKCGKSQPHFGYANDPRPNFCDSCRSNDMIELINKKCKCGLNRPNFGNPNDPRAE